MLLICKGRSIFWFWFLSWFEYLSEGELEGEELLSNLLFIKSIDRFVGGIKYLLFPSTNLFCSIIFCSPILIFWISGFILMFLLLLFIGSLSLSSLTLLIILLLRLLTLSIGVFSELSFICCWLLFEYCVLYKFLFILVFIISSLLIFSFGFCWFSLLVSSTLFFSIVVFVALWVCSYSFFVLLLEL